MAEISLDHPISSIVKDGKVLIVADTAETAGASPDVATEVLDETVVTDVIRALNELEIMNIERSTSFDLLNMITNKRHLERLVINLGAGVSDPFRYGQTPLFLEIIETLYSGPTPYCMLLCRDKHRTKAVLRDLAQIRAPNGILINRSTELRLESFADSFFPVIVKPNELGNSVGISGEIAQNVDELSKCIFQAQQNCCEELIVENFIPGLEVTVLIFGNGNDIRCHALGLAHTDNSPLTENFIRSFESKINPPRNISWHSLASLTNNAIEAEAIEISLKAWYALGCRDAARMDLRLDNKGVLWFIEANAQPDISPETTYVHHMNENVFNDELGVIKNYLMAFFHRCDNSR